MKVVDSLLNRSEAKTFRALQAIADDDLRVFAKPRLSDIVQKTGYLTQREFDFYTRSHCDFVVTDQAYRPQMIVEYDGPLHDDPRQAERDRIKNDLCARAGIGLLRIHDRHVTKLYRGMSILRWIIEVCELGRQFDRLQEERQIPLDEPFDPAAFDSFGGGKRFPYWLSAPATLSFHRFFDSLGDTPHGWNSHVGWDKEGTGYRLSCLSFGDKILWAKTAVRKQNMMFPHYDLLNEIDTSELGLRLAAYRTGRLRAASVAQFRPVFEQFMKRYDGHPSLSSGTFPIEGSWDPQNGWRSK